MYIIQFIYVCGNICMLLRFYIWVKLHYFLFLCLMSWHLVSPIFLKINASLSGWVKSYCVSLLHILHWFICLWPSKLVSILTIGNSVTLNLSVPVCLWHTDLVNLGIRSGLVELDYIKAQFIHSFEESLFWILSMTVHTP